MTKYIFITILLSTSLSFADENWGNIEHGSSRSIGNARFYQDGTTSNKIGNTKFYSDGTTESTIGNTTFRSDGKSSSRIGNTTFRPNNQTGSDVNGTHFYGTKGKSLNRYDR